MATPTSTKKRKQDHSKDGNDDGFLLQTSKQDRRKVQAPTPNRAPRNEFQKLKESLLAAHSRAINQAFWPALMNGRIDPDSNNNGDWPNFIRQEIIEYYLELKRMERIYGPTSGDVVTMGQDDCGQLGVNMHHYSTSKQDAGFDATLLVEQLDCLVDVAAGGLHSVVLKEDGTPLTFGCSDDGCLGREVLPNKDDPEKDPMEFMPTVVKGFRPSKHAVVPCPVDNEDGQIMAVGAGASYCLFLSINGNVYFSGMCKEKDSGKFAPLQPPDDHTNVSLPPKKDDDPPTDPKKSVVGVRTRPIHIFQMPKKIVEIAPGEQFFACVSEDGQVFTMGMGHVGELARSANMEADTVTITCTDVHDKRKEHKYSSYELGHDYFKHSDGSFNEKVVAEHFLTPKPVIYQNPSIKRVATAVACGGAFILVGARSEGGECSQLYSSGGNQYGQLCHGDTKIRHELTLVESLKHLPIGRVAAGTFHSLILDSLGTQLFACGRSGSGQIGAEGVDTSAEAFIATPARVALPRKETEPAVRLVDIECGDNSSFGWTSDGTAYAWGWNDYRQCGMKTYFSDTTSGDPEIRRPYKLPNTEMISPGQNGTQVVDTRIHRISSGSQHTLMVVKRYNPSNENDN